jgi:hypothetical protein
VCALFAHAQVPPPTVVYKNGPQGVGNPPAAKTLVVDIEWANCAGISQVWTAVWDVPQGQFPIMVHITGTKNPTASLLNSSFAPLPSGKNVQFFTEVRDAKGGVIAKTQSGVIQVP